MLSIDVPIIVFQMENLHKTSLCEQEYKTVVMISEEMRIDFAGQTFPQKTELVK